MEPQFSDEAIEMFGEVETTRDFVMTGAHHVRIAVKDDSRDARLTALAAKSYVDGHKVVTVRNSLGNVLYRGVFDLF